jgi:hypothetical protein
MDTTPVEKDEEELTWEDLVERDILEDLDKVTKDDRPIRISEDARNWFTKPMAFMDADEIEKAREEWNRQEYKNIQDPEFRSEFSYEAEKAFERALLREVAGRQGKTGCTTQIRKAEAHDNQSH